MDFIVRAKFDNVRYQKQTINYHFMIAVKLNSIKRKKLITTILKIILGLKRELESV